MEENTPNPLPELHPVVKAFAHLLIIMGLVFVGGSLFSLLGALVSKLLTGLVVKQDIKGIFYEMQDSGKVFGYKILLSIASIGTFIVPALIYALMFSKEKLGAYFGLSGKLSNKLPNIKIVLLVVILVLSAMPVISYLSSLGQSIVMSGGVSQEVIDLQKMNDFVKSRLMEADSILVLLLNIFVIAMIPAIGEELLFRGVLVKTFFKLFNQRIHISIIVAGILFASMHTEAYYLLAMIFMGVVFGYLYYWSGNILVPILAHFLNNALVVVFNYIYTLNPDAAYLNPEYDPGIGAALVGAVIFSGALYLFYKTTRPYHAQTIE